MKGVAIHRELGQCLFLEDRFADAREHLAKARDADPTNKFVLDYDIQVAIAEECFDDARQSIPQLAQIEEESRVQHRLSTLESAVGNVEAAFVAAERAVKANRRPHFEVITQYVRSAIRTKRLDDAREGLPVFSPNGFLRFARTSKTAFGPGTLWQKETWMRPPRFGGKSSTKGPKFIGESGKIYSTSLFEIAL